MAYSKHKVSGRLLQLRHQGFVRSVVSGWYERTWSEARMFHWRRHGRWQVYHPRLKACIVKDDLLTLSSVTPGDVSAVERWKRDRHAVFTISGEMFLGIREALQLAAPSFPNEWLSWASALRRPAVGPCRHRCRPMPRGCSPPKEKIAIQAALVMETTLGSERFQIWFLEALRRFSTPSQWTSRDEDVLVDIARVANSRMDEVDMTVFDMIEESPEAVAATLASTWNEFPELLLVRELLADAELAPAWFRSMRNVK